MDVLKVCVCAETVGSFMRGVLSCDFREIGSSSERGHFKMIRWSPHQENQPPGKSNYPFLGGSRPPGTPAVLGGRRPPRPPGPGASGANRGAEMGCGGLRPPPPILGSPIGAGGAKSGGSGGRALKKANFRIVLG